MIHVVAGVIQRADEVLLARRPIDKHQGGKWEFPGGKVEQDEPVHMALFRELKEELGIEIDLAKPLRLIHAVEHDYSDKHVRIEFFHVTDFSGAPEGKEQQTVAWVKLNQIDQLEFPEANKSIVNGLVNDNFAGS